MILESVLNPAALLQSKSVFFSSLLGLLGRFSSLALLISAAFSSFFF